jgi:hypothetical protein
MKNDLASVCLRIAARLLGKQHEVWARAMRAELDYVAETQRSAWAFGCLIAAIHQRFVSMQTGTLRISRSVLLIEMVLCFLPLTLGWLDVVFGGFGVLQLNSSIIETHLSTSILGMMLGAAVVGCVGPIGLFLTLRAVTTGDGLRNRNLGLAMIAGIAAYAIASVILRLVAGPGAYAADASFILLIIVLPTIGIAHLMYLATPARPALAAA